MKKLMIMIAAVATGAFAFGAGELSNVFDASTATADNWSTGWSGDAALAKTTFDADGNVLKLETGSDALSRLVKADGQPFAMGENVYFDVTLDLLGQALDEVPTNLDGAKLALFFLDTTEIDELGSAPRGTNLYAIARNPKTGGKLLAKMSADAASLIAKGRKTRITVQTYKNVFREGTENSGFVLYLDGGATQGEATPVQIDRVYEYNNDGTVDWLSSDFLPEYLNGKLPATLVEKRRCILLNLKAGVDGQSFTALDFVGNANLSKVEMTNEKYAFIAEDQAANTASIEFSGCSIAVSPAEAYDAQNKTLSADCTITVTLDPGLEILNVSAGDYLVEGENNAFTYTFAAGNNVILTGVDAAVYVNDEPYETVAEALLALQAGGTLKLAKDLADADLEGGMMTFTGEITLDLAGKNIVAAGDAGPDNFGVVYMAEGSLTIINSDESNLGRVESTVADHPAVCCEGGASIRIVNGLFVGTLRDVNKEITPEGEVPPAADAVGITIVGGKFSVEPDGALIAEGYRADKDGDYWVIVKDAATEVAFTVTMGANVTAVIRIDGEVVEPAPETLTAGQTYEVTFTAAEGYMFAAEAQTVFAGTVASEPVEITAPEAILAAARVSGVSYATLQEAVTAALTAGKATIEIANNITIDQSVEITGTGAEAITISNAKTVTFNDLSGKGDYGIKINGAAVTFVGSGTYIKKTGSGSMIQGGASASAAIVVEAGTFIAGDATIEPTDANAQTGAPSNLITSKFGTIVVNGGTFVNYRTDQGRCVRAEQKAADETATLTVNGGSFTTANFKGEDALGSRCVPVDDKGGLGTVIIPATSTATFSCFAGNVTDIMNAFCQKGYELKLNGEGVYAVAPNTWDVVPDDVAVDKIPGVTPEQAEALTAAGVTSSTIVNWAKGAGNVTIGTPINLDAFVMGADNALTTAQLEKKAADEITKEVLDAIVAAQGVGVDLSTIQTKYPNATVELIESTKLQSTETAKFFQLKFTLKSAQ